MKLLEILKENDTNTFIGWRVGKPILNQKTGGIWFAETKEGAENFAKSVLKNDEEAKKYIVTLDNPKYYDSFWHDYMETVQNEYFFDKLGLTLDLINDGYDGILIDTDVWNDTGDELSVTSKQYVAFYYHQVKLSDD